VANVGHFGFEKRIHKIFLRPSQVEVKTMLFILFAKLIFLKAATFLTNKVALRGET
jgi:hypothetical protein